MKKLFTIGAIALACALSNSVSAQGFLNNLLGGLQQAAQQQQTGDGKTGDIVGTIGNVISSVIGDKTTTQASLIGDWSYTKPCVQFESKNLLAQAGGASMATKCENKLNQYYKIVGIKAGALKFSFAEDGTCTYGVGSRSSQGTYTFDAKEKTVTITTMTGQSVLAYVTVLGNEMSLCFDGSKLLTLFTTISSKFNSLSTVSALASSYDGMKVGFRFNQQQK